MDSVASAKDLLRIRSSSPFPIGTTVSFDRAQKTVVVVWSALYLPFRRVVVPLEDIQSAQVRKREHQSGRIAYGLTLRRRSQDDINFSCRTREEAMDTRRAITEFLSPGSGAK